MAGRRWPRGPLPPSPPLDDDAELDRLRAAVARGVARAAVADAAVAAGRRAGAYSPRARNQRPPTPPPAPDGARSTLFDPRARLAAKVAGVLTLAESIREGREADERPRPRRPRPTPRPRRPPPPPPSWDDW